jgi:hypothetical protein
VEERSITISFGIEHANLLRDLDPPCSALQPTPAVGRYLERFLLDEAIPTLTVTGHPATDCAQMVLGSFENTGVRDQMPGLADGTAKFPTFLILTVPQESGLNNRLQNSAGMGLGSV